MLVWVGGGHNFRLGSWLAGPLRGGQTVTMQTISDDHGVTINVSSGQALVLYEWIRRNVASDVRLDQLGIEDAGERMTLWTLFASLERVCPKPSTSGYSARLEAARSRYRAGAEVTKLT